MPALKDPTFNRSKYLSKSAVNFAVSLASSPPVSVSAVLTLSLKTYGKTLAIVASYFAALVFNINLSCQVHTHLSE